MILSRFTDSLDLNLAISRRIFASSRAMHIHLSNTFIWNYGEYRKIEPSINDRTCQATRKISRKYANQWFEILKVENGRWRDEGKRESKSIYKLFNHPCRTRFCRFCFLQLILSARGRVFLFNVSVYLRRMVQLSFPLDNGVSTFWLQPTVHVTQSDIVPTPPPTALSQSRYIKLNVSSAKSHYDQRVVVSLISSIIPIFTLDSNIRANKFKWQGHRIIWN